jgi:hypothetical protein
MLLGVLANSQPQKNKIYKKIMKSFLLKDLFA